MSKNKQMIQDIISTKQPGVTPTVPLDDHIEIVSNRFPKYIHTQETKCNSNGITIVDNVFV